MRAFDREVVDAVVDAVRGLSPERGRSPPLGCQQPPSVLVSPCLLVGAVSDCGPLLKGIEQSMLASMPVRQIGAHPLQQFDCAVPHLDKGNALACPRPPDAVEDRLVVRNPIAQELEQLRSAVHLISPRAALPARLRKRPQ